MPLFLLGFLLRQFTGPAYLLGDFLLGFVGIAVLFLQFHLFICARIGFLHELLVIMLIPFFLGIFLSALMLLNGFVELAHEPRHAGSSLFGALGVLLRRHAPFGRGHLQFIICAFDYHAPIRLAEPFKIKTVGHVLWRLFLTVKNVRRFFQRHAQNPDLLLA